MADPNRLSLGLILLVLLPTLFCPTGAV